MIIYLFERVQIRKQKNIFSKFQICKIQKNMKK